MAEVTAPPSGSVADRAAGPMSVPSAAFSTTVKAWAPPVPAQTGTSLTSVTLTVTAAEAVRAGVAPSDTVTVRA